MTIFFYNLKIVSLFEIKYLITYRILKIQKMKVFL